MDLEPDELFARFVDRTLPYEQWTHEAHLAVCWVALRHRSPEEALPFLRQAIRAYNDTVGTPNTDDSGYHETLTRYYVEAVHAVDAGVFEDLVADPRLGRSAPLDHWSRRTLFSVEARRTWVAPDLVGARNAPTDR